MQRMAANSSTGYKISSWLIPIMPLFIALMGWLNGLDGKELWLQHHPIVTALLRRFQEGCFPFYLVSWLIWLAALVYRKNGDPWVVKHIQFILDSYQAKAFDLEKCTPNIPKDHNRATLFRCQRSLRIRHWTANHWYWPWGVHTPFSKFLIPVLRSGHISKNSRAAFFVSDDSSKTEGVAGRAWSSDRVIFEENLPKTEALTSPARKAAYAKRTGCSVEMVEKRLDDGLPMPRSMLSFPIRRRGKLWGVIVIDSRYPKGIHQDAPERFQLTLTIIERLLERVS